MRIGLLPDTGILWTLPKKIGMSKARELLSLAREIDGVEAGRIGLANQVVEPGQALRVAIDYARALAQQPPLGMALLKSALTYSTEDMDAALRAEIDFQPVLRQSKDHLEAANAFIEKRAPVFTGQ
ncbi:1,2-epoxyphenylacetyl-CoA isomerase [compost metagenome]